MLYKGFVFYSVNIINATLQSKWTGAKLIKQCEISASPKLNFVRFKFTGASNIFSFQFRMKNFVYIICEREYKK